MMRLQTFPLGYEIVGNLRSAQRQLGNAVPSALAERVALEIRRQLLGEPAVTSKQLSLVPDRRLEAPAEERVATVPPKYLGLVGRHQAHPGTGRGYGAMRRSEAGD
jgi:DNA (cytosine-5)-methyltransferase 1